MTRLFAHFIWAAALTASIWSIAKYSAEYSIEDSKQTAFLADACIKAGGEWVKNFGPSWNCTRPAEGGHRK